MSCSMMYELCLFMFTVEPESSSVKDGGRKDWRGGRAGLIYPTDSLKLGTITPPTRIHINKKSTTGEKHRWAETKGCPAMMTSPCDAVKFPRPILAAAHGFLQGWRHSGLGALYSDISADILA